MMRLLLSRDYRILAATAVAHHIWRYASCRDYRQLVSGLLVRRELEVVHWLK